MNVPLLLLFKESPEFYPSRVAVMSQETKFDFKKEIKMLLKNKNYLLLLTSFVMLYSIYTCMGSIINDIV